MSTGVRSKVSLGLGTHFGITGGFLAVFTFWFWHDGRDCDVGSDIDYDEDAEVLLG